MPAKEQKYRALTDLSLWKDSKVRPEPFEDPDQWLNWKEGEVFTPPKHMNIAKALERGIVELVGD